MKFKWYTWIFLAIVVVLIYPKPCGTVIPSTVLEYSCLGFETPLIGLLQNPDIREQWCSGICTSKNIDPEKYTRKIVNNDSSQDTMAGSPLGGITGTIGSVIPAMLLIGGIIGVVVFINTMQKKSKTTSNITVIRGPGQ